MISILLPLIPFFLVLVETAQGRPNAASASLAASYAITSHITLNATQNGSVAREPDFPPGIPGQEPGDGTIYYDLQWTKMPITLKFTAMFVLEDPPPLEERQSVIQEAIIASSDPAKADVTMRDASYEWGRMRSCVDARPEPGRVRLTWYIWTQTLVAIAKFVEAYPWLDFDALIYVYRGGGDQPAYLGYGSVFDGLRPDTTFA